MDTTVSTSNIVVGSSPLMLMQAIVLAESGEQVCVLDRHSNIGGSWRTFTDENGVEVEIACHVLEAFPGVYEALEQYSGVPFVILNKQPVRIHRSGFQVEYFSRALLALSGAYMLFGYLRSLVGLLRRHPEDENTYINFKTKLHSLLKYQLGYMFMPTVMKGPEHGYVRFVGGLVEKCRSLGVEFRQFDVAELHLRNRNWTVTDIRGRTIDAKKVHVTTSVNLKRKDECRFVVAGNLAKPRRAVVVEFARQDVADMHTYVAFWKNPILTRISRVEALSMPAEIVRYLVEFRSGFGLDGDEVFDDARRGLMAANIIKEGAAFEIIMKVDCENSLNTEQLPDGELEPGLHCYRSFGNLAAGVAVWLQSAR